MYTELLGLVNKSAVFQFITGIGFEEWTMLVEKTGRRLISQLINNKILCYNSMLVAPKIFNVPQILEFGRPSFIISLTQCFDHCQDLNVMSSVGTYVALIRSLKVYISNIPLLLYIPKHLNHTYSAHLHVQGSIVKSTIKHKWFIPNIFKRTKPFQK